MRVARVSVGLLGVVVLMVATLAVATIWLLLTNPVTIAAAVSSGEVTPLVEELAGALFNALLTLLKWL